MKAKIATVFTTLFVTQLATGNPPGGVLQIDNALFKDKPLFCEEEILVPSKSDFDIVDYSLMNSDDGERYAILNIKNQSSGQRLLKRENLVAIFADCTSLHPEELNQALSGQESVTQTVYFGKSQFPIIKIITDE